MSLLHPWNLKGSRTFVIVFDLQLTKKISYPQRVDQAKWNLLANATIPRMRGAVNTCVPRLADHPARGIVMAEVVSV